MEAFLGLMSTVKSEAVAGTVTELFPGTGSLLLAEDTVPAPLLTRRAGVGTRSIVTVAVEPDCSGAMAQTRVVLPEVWLQPEVDLKVTGTIVAAGLRSAVTVMLVATSGPLLVTVYVNVTWLPALTNCCPAASEIFPVMARSAPVPTFTAKAANPTVFSTCNGHHG